MMMKEIFTILTIWIILIGCQNESSSINIIGNWKLAHSEVKPLNIYGVDFDISRGSMICFEEKGIVKISDTKNNTSMIQYGITEDTVITHYEDNNILKHDSTSIIYLGKTDDYMSGYQIKQITSDSMILISKFRKEQLGLPKPNEFGTNPDLFKDYEIVLVREK